jgi:hypothetical protein
VVKEEVPELEVLPLTETIIRAWAAMEEDEYDSLASGDSEACAGAHGGRAIVDQPLR